MFLLHTILPTVRSGNCSSGHSCTWHTYSWHNCQFAARKSSGNYRQTKTSFRSSAIELLSLCKSHESSSCSEWWFQCIQNILVWKSAWNIDLIICALNFGHSGFVSGVRTTWIGCFTPTTIWSSRSFKRSSPCPVNGFHGADLGAVQGIEIVVQLVSRINRLDLECPNREVALVDRFVQVVSCMAALTSGLASIMSVCKPRINSLKRFYAKIMLHKPVDGTDENRHTTLSHDTANVNVYACKKDRPTIQSIELIYQSISLHILQQCQWACLWRVLISPTVAACSSVRNSAPPSGHQWNLTSVSAPSLFTSLYVFTP